VVAVARQWRRNAAALIKNCSGTRSHHRPNVDRLSALRFLWGEPSPISRAAGMVLCPERGGWGNVSAFVKRQPIRDHLAISRVESDLTSPSADPLLQLPQTDEYGGSAVQRGNWRNLWKPEACPEGVKNRSLLPRSPHWKLKYKILSFDPEHGNGVAGCLGNSSSPSKTQQRTPQCSNDCS
jgi:hypothetical protein